MIGELKGHSRSHVTCKALYIATFTCIYCYICVSLCEGDNG